jgi:uncharacterized membrane protein HdeD (DUF308 family)
VVRAHAGALLDTAHDHLTGHGRTLRALFAWLLLAMFGISCALVGLVVAGLTTIAPSLGTPLLGLWLLFFAVCRVATALMNSARGSASHGLVGLLAAGLGFACLHGTAHGPVPVAMAAALALGVTALVDGVTLVRYPRSQQTARLGVRAAAALLCALVVTYNLSYPPAQVLRAIAVAAIVTGVVDTVLGLLTGRHIAGLHRAVQAGRPVARWLPWFGE